MIRQFEAAVQRIRALGGDELKSGNYALSALGLVNAVYFQGEHSNLCVSTRCVFVFRFRFGFARVRLSVLDP